MLFPDEVAREIAAVHFVSFGCAIFFCHCRSGCRVAKITDTGAQGCPQENRRQT
jgi:hypothetical protein